MANVGWIGLGRLGAPCAAALAYHGGHTVIGYDVRGVQSSDYDWSGLPAVKLVESIDRVVAETDGVVFLSVQTPHAPEYGGSTIAPIETREFEYGYLVAAVWDVCAAAATRRTPITLVIVSTVLPGTFDRHLRAIVGQARYVTPVYHPFFIAMGTVIDDFVTPEMTLFGVDQADDELPVLALYGTMHDDGVPAPTMSIPSAELTKVAYNTFISAKIVFANTLMQLAEGTGANVDAVTDALALGHDRIISSRYLTAGVGDGGACHPRDNIALSDLARRVGAFDLMGTLTRAREEQTRWLATIVTDWADLTGLRIVVLGRAYKPEIALDDGSPALLLAEVLDLAGYAYEQYDPVMDPNDEGDLTRALDQPRTFVVVTRHQRFRTLPFPVGSVVIDPFGYVERRSGVTYVTPGRRGSGLLSS